MAAVSNTMAPAWCAAASATGTTSSKVLIPRVICNANAASNRWLPILARGCSSNFPALNQNIGMRRNSSIASTRWSNCTVTIFSKKLRHSGDRSNRPTGINRPSINGKVLKAKPARVPATKPPLNAVMKITVLMITARRANDGYCLLSVYLRVQ